MFGLLALLFIVVPIVELYVIVQVSHALGVLPTIALVLAVSMVGAWLCKREGLGIYRRIGSEVQRGALPGASLVDGFLVLFGGALLLTPGFVTDALGLALLMPPVRFVVRTVLMRRFARQAAEAVRGGGGAWPGGRSTRIYYWDGRASGSPGHPGGGPGERIIDVDEAAGGPSPDDPPRLGR